MKARKAIAAFLSAGMALGCMSGAVLASAEETHSITSTITEDGTIITESKNGNTYLYTPYENDRILRIHHNNYAILAECTDTEAFQAAFSEDYKISELSDGRLCIVGQDAPENFAYNTDCSLSNTTNWTYAEASASVIPLLRSGYISALTIQQAYQEYSSSLIPSGGAITVYADRELTASDFSWQESDTYTIDGNTAQWADGTFSEWADRYQFMKTALETVPDVYAVLLTPPYIDAIWLGYTFEDACNYTAQSRGDITGDNKPDADDAYEALLYYAKTQTDGEAFFTDNSDEAKETAAYAAADVNSDNVINADDAYLILQYYAKTAAGLTPVWD